MMLTNNSNIFNNGSGFFFDRGFGIKANRSNPEIFNYYFYENFSTNHYSIGAYYSTYFTPPSIFVYQEGDITSAQLAVSIDTTGDIDV